MPKAGTVTIVFMEVGKTTRELGLYKTGDSIMSLTGPLGLPTHIENYGTVVCVAGGFAFCARISDRPGNKTSRNKYNQYWAHA